MIFWCNKFGVGQDDEDFYIWNKNVKYLSDSEGVTELESIFTEKSYPNFYIASIRKQ